jgi:hypothetical protein
VTIWKFVLPIKDFVRVDMPEGARILSAQEQHDEICVWAAVNPRARLIPHGFAIRGTGHPLGVVGRFIGTIQTHGGSLVWHVFEAS